MYLEKNLLEQQTQPIYDTGSGNRTWATLVEGERPHHCTIPASQIMSDFKFSISLQLWHAING